MPWRWSLWSQNLTNALHYVEHGRGFFRDAFPKGDDEKDEDKEDDEQRKASIKKIKRRLKDFKEREVLRELQRVG